ncbi:MAG: ComEC/Rec2 family competence protein [Bacteroides sp.]|nr:ComEC/Rec2 family competence protein [Bacteroides sp.]
MYKGPLVPTLALASGIGGSYLCALPWWCGVIPIAIAIAIYLFLLGSSKNPVASFRMGKWHVVWVVILFAGIGVTDESINRPLNLVQAFGQNVPDSLFCEVTGVLTKTYGERIDVVLYGTNGAKARIRSGVTEVSPGDIIVIPIKQLKEISNDTTEIGLRIMPMMRAAGILYSGRIVPKGIVLVGKSRSPRWFFVGLREKMESVIERSLLNKHTADFLNAILLGDKTGLDEDTRLAFSSGGLAHMLALSGLHIGILSGLLIFIMWPLKLSGRYKWGYYVAIVVLWLYVAVTGMAYSSVRACIMTTFVFIGIISERKNFSGNALYSSCLLILLMDPLALFDAGFQLSVVCVGALIAFATPLNPIGHRHHAVLFYICGSLIATMVATAASWVLISYYFSQIPLMFLPSNLLILPILPFYMVLAVVFLFLFSMGWEIEWMGYALDQGYDYMLKSVYWLSNGTEFVVEYQVPLWGVVLWMILLAGGAYAVNRKDMK